MTPTRATLALLAGLVAMLPYAATPTFGPTYDDHHHVTRHPLLQSPDVGLRDLLSGQYLAVPQPDRARPVHLLSLLLDRVVLEPRVGRRFAAHHLGSVLAHGGVVALLFLLLGALGFARWPAWFGAVLFGVHPAAVEAVAGVSNREDSLAALFTLAFLLSAKRFWRTGRHAALAGAFATLMLALGSKESAAIAPVLLLWLAWIAPDRFGPWSRERLAPLGMVVACCLTAFVGLQWHLGAPGLSMFAGSGPLAPQLSVPFHVDWLSAVPIEAYRIGRLALGAPLSAEHDPAALAHPSWIGLGAVALLALLGLAVTLRQRRSRWLAPLGWIAIATLPVLPSPWLLNPIADRYLYLPALALGLVGALAASSRRRFVPLGLAVALVLAAVSTPGQAARWRDDVTLFQHAARHAPGSARVHLNLGSAHLRRGELSLAIAPLERAATLEPGSVPAHYALGELWLQRGDNGRATSEMAQAATLPARVGEMPLHDRAFFAYAGLLHRRGDHEALRRAVLRERTERPDSRPAAVWWARLPASSRTFE